MQANPAQPVHLDEVTMTGADWVPVDASGDLRAAAALDRVVDTYDKRARWGKRRNKQAKQNAADAEPHHTARFSTRWYVWKART